MEDAMAAAFNDYFHAFDIRINPNEILVGRRRSLSHRGWHITMRIDPDDSGAPVLEFYACHRMTNDRHVRIWADGHLEHLDAIHQFYVYDPNRPGSEEEARRDYFAHNQKVAQELREKRLD